MISCEGQLWSVLLCLVLLCDVIACDNVMQTTFPPPLLHRLTAMADYVNRAMGKTQWEKPQLDERARGKTFEKVHSLEEQVRFSWKSREVKIQSARFALLPSHTITRPNTVQSFTMYVNPNRGNE